MARMKKIGVSFLRQCPRPISCEWIAQLQNQRKIGGTVRRSKGIFDKEWYAVFKLDEKNRDENNALGYVHAQRLKSLPSKTVSPKKMKPPRLPV